MLVFARLARVPTGFAETWEILLRLPQPGFFSRSTQHGTAVIPLYLVGAMLGITGSSYGSQRATGSSRGRPVTGAGVRGIQSLRKASNAQNSNPNPYGVAPRNPQAYVPDSRRSSRHSAIPSSAPAPRNQSTLQQHAAAIGPAAVRFGGKVYRLDPATGKLLSPRSAANAKADARRKWTPEILAKMKEEERQKAQHERQRITQQQRQRGRNLAPGAKEVHTAPLAKMGLEAAIVLLQNKLRHSSRLRHNLQTQAKHANGQPTFIGKSEFASAVVNAGVELHPDDVAAVFDYADDDRDGMVPFSKLIARITNDPVDQGISKVHPTTTLQVAPDDEKRYQLSRDNHRKIMNEASLAILPRLGFERADELLRQKYQSKGEQLRRVFLRICRNRGPVVGRSELTQALKDFNLNYHDDDLKQLLDFYLNPSNFRQPRSARPPPRGKVDYHVFLDALGRDKTGGQPLFDEMFAHDASIEHASQSKKDNAKPRAQGFRHVQEALQKHMDKSDDFLLSFLAADINQQAAISFEAFVQLVENAGFRFARSDLEAVFGRTDDDQDHRLDLDEFLRNFCRDRFAYNANLRSLPGSAFEKTQLFAERGKSLPRLGAKRCREVVENAFRNQNDKKFLEFFRQQFLKTLKRRNLKEMPDDPEEQDRLILEAHLTYEEFKDFVQDITNLRLAAADIEALFDSFAVARSAAGASPSSVSPTGYGAGKVIHLKSFIKNFNQYTDEHFAYLKSYIMNPYHRDMTFASQIPEVGVTRARETLVKKYREMPDNLTLYKILRRRDADKVSTQLWRVRLIRISLTGVYVCSRDRCHWRSSASHCKNLRWKLLAMTCSRFAGTCKCSRTQRKQQLTT